MARIVVDSYLVRYPLGGMMSWVLQYLVGLQRLGHDVYFVERSGAPMSCVDPRSRTMTDDCTYGTAVVHDLLTRFDLGDRWCFLDAGGAYHGLARSAVEEVFRTADVFLDMGTTDASWLSEAEGPALRVFLDGEPGTTQMRMANARAAGQQLPGYDRYYTAGMNIGTAASSAPTGGVAWGHLFHPVATERFGPLPAPSSADAPFTTVMNWQSNATVEHQGRTYGNKDLELPKFLDLPRHARARLEMAVGDHAPSHLVEHGWLVRDAVPVTISFDAFVAYAAASRGEFGVCKQAFVATRCGWFSDRSALYLALGRPVVLQDTGFSDHLPCGEGLFAVNGVEDAAAAIDEIVGDPARQGRAAREIAVEHLDTGRVLGGFLAELGVS